MEVDDGHGVARVRLDDFEPQVVHPGAIFVAGTRGFEQRVHVLRTELNTTATGAAEVHVTFSTGPVISHETGTLD